MKILVILPLVAAAVLAAPVPPFRASSYTDELYGFSVQAPTFPRAAEGTTVIPVIFMAPAESGFSSNVNIQIQNVDMTMKEYMELTHRQFKGAGMTVLSEVRKKVGDRNAVEISYEGVQGGRRMKWIALAVAGEKKIYLLTCTALKDQFAKIEKAFRKCIESFKLGR